MVVKLEFTADSTKEQYVTLYTLEVGSVFKVRSSDFETVMRRIEEFKPCNLNFSVFPINPGTALYTTYGADHCVITDNSSCSKIITE